ncbi:His Kinase A (phospho-acceptor) domain-containing protein [Sinomicrobium oceani]|uniref:histidine kinase n=1 Tax=Sinomicrobium oceani TaxID=1150368 RepID=A0A1K1RPI3_9FLAO|nr:ATP-binding protein [Sinomicrobium oceani]SFW73716.1 His Kinase A (phospho-acceptor) domain-containing protein [Sinomicrobium oceani]
MKGHSHILFSFFVFFLPGLVIGQYNHTVEDSVESTIREVYVYKNRFDLVHAVEQLQHAVKISDTLKRKRSPYLFDCYTLFIQLYLDFDRSEDLQVYEFLSESNLRPNPDIIKEARFLSLKALKAARNENYSKAARLIEEAKALVVSENQTERNRVYYYEAQIFLEQKKYKQAIALLQEVYPLQDNYEQKYINAGILLDLASACQKLKASDRAVSYMEKATVMLQDADFPKLELRKNLLWTDILLALGKKAEAETYMTQARQFKEKYFNAYAIEQRSDVAYQNTSNFKDRVIKQYRTDAGKLARQVNIAKMISIFSSILVIVIFILTMSLYRNNKIKLKTNNLLVKKNKELQTAKEEAEKALQVKARFLSTVSHELRTPLYAVTGLTHLLLEENPKESQKEYLNSLKFSGEYLLNFINDILQVNKSEANQLKVKRVPFNMEQMLVKVVRSLEHSAKENNNTISLNLDRNIPAKLIGDSLKLSQVFINLIGNALKFTESGEVMVRGNILKKTTDNITIRFEVQDNGMGIESETLPLIFDSFAQGSTQINRKYGGTGLGLTIVKNLLNLMGSDIKVESSPGKGSTFTFDLSLTTTGEIEISGEAVPAVEEELTEEEIVFENIHVLLVEDNKINQVVTKKMLAKKNITSEVANDGYEAIEMAKNNTYDLILMDIHMPGISGIVATEEIRKFNKKVPIVALTAISLEENMDALYNAGCNDIITKPFKPQVFYKKIRNCLDRFKRQNS